MFVRPPRSGCSACTCSCSCCLTTDVQTPALFRLAGFILYIRQHSKSKLWQVYWGRQHNPRTGSTVHSSSHVLFHNYLNAYQSAVRQLQTDLGLVMAGPGPEGSAGDRQQEACHMLSSGCSAAGAPQLTSGSATVNQRRGGQTYIHSTTHALASVQVSSNFPSVGDPPPHPPGMDA
jgi:hypothetical protein